MKKIVSKMLIILVIFQVIFCISNINIVTADPTGTDTRMTDLDSQSKTFSEMGANKISSLGISIIGMTEPLGIILGLVHFVAIALTSLKLLLTLLRIIKDDTVTKSQAKKSLTVDLVILFLAIAGIPWAKKIIAML